MPEEAQHLLVLHRTRFNSIIPVCTCGNYYGTAHKIRITQAKPGSAKKIFAADAEEAARQEFKDEHLKKKVTTDGSN